MDEEIDIKMAAIAESNKFDMLCDGVLNSIAMVQATLAEFLSLKDELLIHALPPTLMARLIMVSGRIFRSTNDLQTPVNELVRMVRVYSVSWEEKSAALKKLHTDYESKHKQLNIAIRRLQMLDSQAKRMAKEKRIMMWEKLFSKVTSCRGHGRRWKFLIDTFKQKSKLGMEHLQAYIETLDREPDADNDGDNEEDNGVDARSQSSVNELQLLSSSDELDFTEESESEDDDEKEDGQGSTARATAQTQQDELDSDIVTPASKRVTFLDHKRGLRAGPDGGGDGPEVIPETVIVEVPAPKPPMTDKSVWTHEPEYDWFLNVKVFHPSGIQGADIKCSVNFKKEFQKTDFYERPRTRGQSSGSRSQLRSGRSMIGSRVNGNQPQKSVTLQVPGESGVDSRWQNLVFALGERPLFELEDPLTKKEEGEEIKMPEGKSDPLIARPPQGPRLPADGEGGDEDENKDDQERVQSGRSATTTTSSLGGEMPVKLGVHQGHLDELVAMGNIDLADLRGEEIPVFDSVEGTGEMVPLSFPIYPIKPSRKLKASPEAPVGSLPIVFFYTRIHRPFTFEKHTESASIVEIVEDLTGVDLNNMRKEDLSINKNYDDRCLSAMTIRSTTTEEKPDMIPKAELDVVLEQHQQELNVLTEDFESRIRDLAGALEAVQTEQLNMLSNGPPARTGSQSKTAFRGWTPGRDSHVILPQPPDTKDQARKRPKKSGMKLPDWGSDLPKDFLDRLRLFNEESDRRRQNMVNKTKGEVSSHIEKQLAGQYKLSLHNDANADITKDVSLPAVFMPTRTGQLYNPRAHHYFHPTGSLGHLRLTQPPSIFELPPLPPKAQMSVINLFDIRKSMNWVATQDWTDRIPQTPAELLANTPHPGTPMTDPLPNITADDSGQ